MASSHICQTLYSLWADQASSAANGITDNVLSAVHPYFVAALGLYVILLGKQTAMGKVGLEHTTRQAVRAVVIAAFMTASLYSEYITNVGTTVIPNAIASMVSGGSSSSGPQQFDNLIDALWSLQDAINKQATGVAYIGDRIANYVASLTGTAVLVMTSGVWTLSKAVIVFLLPLGAFLIPLFLFDKVAEIPMRWVGKLISLFLVLVLCSMVGQFIVSADQAYARDYAKAVASNSSADSGFSMSAGDLQMTAFSEGLSGPAIGAAPDAQTTANIDASLQAMFGYVAVALFGLFVLTILTGIALFIGGASGFSAAPAVTAIYMITTAGINKMRGR